MNRIEEQTSSMDNAINSNMHNIIENTLKSQTSCIPIKFLTSKTSKENTSPFQTSLNKNQKTIKNALPYFDLKNLKLGNKLGNGSQSVVYEIKSFSTKCFNSLLCQQRAK